MLTNIEEQSISNVSQQTSTKSKAKSLSVMSVLRSCASVKIFFYSLIWLLILLIVGTISQKEIGLFASQERYFSSIFIWVGIIPLPGARLVLMTMFTNLLAKLLFKSPWRLKQSGTIIAHFGALVLLGGGVLTAYFSLEGSMYLPEGTTSMVFEEYHARELVLIDKSDPDADKVYSYSGSKIAAGGAFTNKNFKGSFEIKASYKNCDFKKRSASKDSGFKGLALTAQIMPIKPNVEDSQNRYGVIVEIKNMNDDANGVYFICEWMDTPQVLTIEGKQFELILRKRQHQLPFSIELKDFRKIDYQGTRKAKSFESDLIIRENGSDGSEAGTHALVKMNQPLIRDNFVFYQSSFISNEQGEVSVLSVVKNYGRSVPYISSIIICIGLLLHLGLKLPELNKRITKDEGSQDV